MFKKASIHGLAVIGASCLIILLVSQWYSNPLKHKIQWILRADCSSENTTDIDEVDVLNEIKRVIDLDRRMVREDMMDYQYPNGTDNMSASRLEDLVIEENGQPIRSIILTTWRTGSTFLGEIIGSHPGNFHHFEPLADLGMVKVRGPPLAQNALKRIRALLNCDYTDEQDKLISFARTYPYVLEKSSYLWKQCTTNSSICYNHRYLSALCKLHPFQSMKIIRLSLHAAEELLADENIHEVPYAMCSRQKGFFTNYALWAGKFEFDEVLLAVRFVLLVRDPRGIFRSRQHKNFCRNGPDCSEPPLLCADLVSDYKIAVKLLKKYPTTFRVIRYEDLAADPYGQMEKLSEFYGRNFHPKMREYLDTHTKSRSGGSFSTFRNTKTTPYHWKTELKFEEVQEIQESCATAMKYWGYLPALNSTHQIEFDPVTEYDTNT